MSIPEENPFHKRPPQYSDNPAGKPQFYYPAHTEQSLPLMPPAQEEHIMVENNSLLHWFGETFEFSQGNWQAQLAFAVELARRYEGSVSLPILNAEQRQIAHAYILSIVQSPRPEEPGRHLPLPLEKPEDIAFVNKEPLLRYDMMVTAVNNYDYPNKRNHHEEIAELYEMSEEALLDEILLILITADYHNLIEKGGRQRKDTNTWSFQTDKFVSHICHMAIPGGRVQYSDGMPPSYNFQVLFKRLQTRLMLLANHQWRDLKFSADVAENKRIAQDLLKKLKSVIDFHNQHHSKKRGGGNNASLKPLKQRAGENKKKKK